VSREHPLLETSCSKCPLRIGCAGWSIARETTEFFPAGPSHLERYAQTFNACEINSSFYRPHKLETWERWTNSVPAEFRFSVKAPRTITHASALQCGEELLRPFFHQISYLKDKLGPVLFQLPPKLEFEPAHAKRFLASVRQLYAGDAVWEPRHPSWFTEKADSMLKEFEVSRVAADPARVPSAGQPGGRSSLVYFRLHGSPRIYYSPYSDDYLHSLAVRMVEVCADAEVWCIFDNTASGFAVPNAVKLQEILRGLKVDS
jgi:uncharacterized protein YecE (DUF72 family)